jgi:hypothetical protein
MTDRMDAAIDAYLNRLRREERDAMVAQRVRRLMRRINLETRKWRTA